MHSVRRDVRKYNFKLTERQIYGRCIQGDDSRGKDDSAEAMGRTDGHPENRKASDELAGIQPRPIGVGQPAKRHEKDKEASARGQRPTGNPVRGDSRG
jgi:hypothetical protein